MLKHLKTIHEIVTVCNGLPSTVLGSNWPSVPIYHLQTRNLRLHGRLIKATTFSSVSSARSFSTQTFIFHFRFSSFLCFQLSASLLMDQTRMNIITLYFREAFIA